VVDAAVSPSTPDVVAPDLYEMQQVSQQQQQQLLLLFVFLFLLFRLPLSLPLPLLDYDPCLLELIVDVLLRRSFSSLGQDLLLFLVPLPS